MGVALLVATGVGAGIGAGSSAAGAQEVTWSGSLGYATGSYIFSEQFRTLSFLTSLTLRARRLEVTASLPVLAQNGSAVSYVAGIPLPTGGPDNGAVQRRRQGTTIPVRPGGGRGRGGSGGNGAMGALVADDSVADSLSVSGTGAYDVRIGDPMIGTSITAFEGVGVIRTIGLDAVAKVPVASLESGAGSGAWDYGAGGSLALGVGEALVFANATWWVLGDLPDLELRDALFYSLAVGRGLGDRWSWLASANASTRIVQGSDPPASLSLFLSRRLSDGASLSVNAGVGLTESASAFSIGAGWSTRLLGSGR